MAEAGSTGRLHFATTRVAGFALACLTLLAAGAIGCLLLQELPSRRRDALVRWQGSLAAVADDRCAVVDLWVDDRLADARLLAAHVAAAGPAAAGHPSPERAGAQQQVQPLLDGMVEAGRYRGAYLLDDGFSPVGSSADAPALESGCLSAARAATGKGDPSVAFCRDTSGDPLVLTVVPLRRGTGDEPVLPAAAVALATDPDTWLYPLLRRLPIVSSSAEALLVQRDGPEALYLSPLRYADSPPLTLRVPLSWTGVEASRALAGEETPATTSDYRGQAVLAASCRLRAAPWNLVVKVDRSEATSTVRTRTMATAAAAGASLALALLAGATAWWARCTHRRGARLDEQVRAAALLDHVADAVLLIGDDGRVIRANRRAQEMYGQGGETLVGQRVPDHLVLPWSPADSTDHDAQTTDSGAVLLDTLHRTETGATLPVEVSSRRVDLAGESGWVSVVRDVSARKRSEDALRRAELLTRSIMDSLASSIAVLSPSGEIIRVNRAWREFAAANGASPATIAGVGLDYLAVTRLALPDEVAQEALAGMHAVLAGREPSVTLEYPCHSPDAERWFVLSVTPLDAERRGLVAAHVDVTERKRAEQELRASERRLTRAQRVGRLGSWEWDLVANTLSWSPGLCSLWGIGTDSELTFESIEAIIHPEDRADNRRHVDRLLQAGADAGEWELRVVRPDGAIRHVYQHVEVNRADGGRPVRMVGIMQDVTERAKADLERERLLERVRGLASRLSDQDEARRTDLARELHDRVGQNLSALGLTLNIVRTQLASEAAPAVFTRLDDAAGLVEEATRQVRDVMTELRPPLLDEVGLLAALRWHGEQFTHRTGTPCSVAGKEPGPDLPASAAIALFRVAQEALANVAKHAHARTVSVRLRAAGRKVALVVEDDGVGFDRSPPLAPHAPGWGLVGMQERVEGVGGTLTVESTPGRGTTVTVEVPRCAR